MDTPRVTIRLDANGGLLDVDVEGANDTTDLVEERAPIPSVADVAERPINRNWLAG